MSTDLSEPEDVASNGTRPWSRDRPTVLLVGGSETNVRTYAAWLQNTYQVWMVTTVNDARTRLDERVDVILIDERTADMSWRRFVGQVRDRKRPHRIAVITDREPEATCVDAYLVAPITNVELHTVVSTLRKRVAYDKQFRTFQNLIERKVTLDNQPESHERTAIENRIVIIRQAMDRTLADLLETDDRESLLADFTRSVTTQTTAPNAV